MTNLNEVEDAPKKMATMLQDQELVADLIQQMIFFFVLKSEKEDQSIHYALSKKT